MSDVSHVAQLVDKCFRIIFSENKKHTLNVALIYLSMFINLMVSIYNLQLAS